MIFFFFALNRPPPPSLRLLPRSRLVFPSPHVAVMVPCSVFVCVLACVCVCARVHVFEMGAAVCQAASGTQSTFAWRGRFRTQRYRQRRDTLLVQVAGAIP